MSPRLLAALAFLACAASSASAGVGDTPESRFREAPVDALGVTSLSDLRGKPVLVDSWGTR